MVCDSRAFGEAVKCATERPQSAMLFDVYITAASHVLCKQESGNSNVLLT